MILVGSQRSGASNLANHLMNDRDNDHVTLFEVRGFIARDLHGAFAEAHAISKGTKCEQFLFSLSFNPPQNETATEQDFEQAIEKAEQKLGLTDQPRAIVFHEKEGRRHAHVVWSRIDAKSMRAINMAHFKTKLTSLSRELYLEHDWELPNGLRLDSGRSPLNFTLAEWQQAKRLKLDPREIKQSFQDAWQQSDGQKGFKHALEERGYFLAQGDRRGFVALNIDGEVFSVARMIGVKTKEVKAKLGDPKQLASVTETRTTMTNKITDQLHHYRDEVDQAHAKAMEPLNDERTALRDQQRKERKAQHAKQVERQRDEAAQRAKAIRTGLAGLWDRMTGRHKTVLKEHEHQTWQSAKRDQQERDAIVQSHLDERQVLQKRILSLRKRHSHDRRILAREISQTIKAQQRDDQAYRLRMQHEYEQQTREKKVRGPSLSL